MLNDNRIRSQANRDLSQIYATMQDAEHARSNAERALHFAQIASEDEVRIYALTALGESEARPQHYDAAQSAFKDSHAYWPQHGRSWNAVNPLANLGDIAAARFRPSASPPVCCTDSAATTRPAGFCSPRTRSPNPSAATAFSPSFTPTSQKCRKHAAIFPRPSPRRVLPQPSGKP